MAVERRPPRAWFDAMHDEIVLVAVGTHSVLGFAYLSPREKSGYRFTREATVYVEPAHQREGIGRALLEALIAGGRERDLHHLSARIEAGNAASLALFEALGFERAGLEREVGYKHGRWLDVVTLQLLLQPAADLEARVEPGLRTRLVATREEMEQALSVRRAVFVVGQGISEDEEIDAHDDPAASDVVHVLARLDGRPVATARLLLNQPEGEFPHVGRVAVLEEMRGRHYGEAVMEALHEEARRRGHRGVTLAAQEHAVGFYAHLGYVARGEIFLDAGIEHRWMDIGFEDEAGGEGGP